VQIVVRLSDNQLHVRPVCV